jgi:hypothetical protein
MVFLRRLLVFIVLLACGGCTPTDQLSPDPLNQQVASASQALGMLVDASIQAVLSDQTASGTTHAAGDPVPDLRSLERATRTIDLATLSVNGQLVFPAGTASGTITLSTSGAAATSWPTGSAILYTGSVQVALNQILFTNGNGDRLAIPSGTFTHTLDAQAVKTATDNWTVSVDATASMAPALAATLTRGSGSYSLTLGGSRRVRQTITRIKDATTDTRTDARQVDGSSPGTGLTTDPTLAGLGYTAWTITLNGIPVTWNRNAELTSTIDYSTGTTTVAVSRDASFITTEIGGLTSIVGPFTAIQGSLLLQAQLDPAWL